MPVVICLLRGINVGGQHKVSMAALRDLCQSLDLRDTCTLLQSGNALFHTNERNLSALKKRFEAGFGQTFGFHSEIILRTTADLNKVLADNPFAKRSGIEPGKLNVTFLVSDPRQTAEEEILQLKIQPEELHLIGRELFIYFPDGMGRSKLPWAKLDKILGTTGTTRNWNTVNKLLEMAEKMEASAKPARKK